MLLESHMRAELFAANLCLLLLEYAKFCEDPYMSDLTGETISRLMNFHVLHQVAAGFEFLRTLQRKIS